MNASEKITAKLQDLETAKLLEVIEGLRTNASDEADIVLGNALTVLELRIPVGLYTEAEFIALCDDLAA